MRVVPVLPALSLALLALPAALKAQDATTLAMQQTTQLNAQIATQQANDAQQQALLNQQLNQQTMQQAADAANGPYTPAVRSPEVKVTHGAAPGTLVVTLKPKGRSQDLFYSFGVWSPTRRSMPYDGPVTLEAGQTLMAVAYAPDGSHSELVSVTAPGTPPPHAVAAVSHDASAEDLRRVAAGTPLTLAFRSEVTSQNLAIGDSLPVELASDWIVNGVRLASKGTPVRVTVSHVDAAGRAGLGGELGFTARSITLQGVTIPLEGAEVMEAVPISTARLAAVLVPVVGPTLLLKHGHQAVIPPGATFEAVVQEPRAVAMRAANAP